jgi:hypothetical protein
MEYKSDFSSYISSESNGLVSLKECVVDELKGPYEIAGEKYIDCSYSYFVKFNKDCYMYVNKSGSGPYLKSFKTYREVPEFVPSLEMQVVECPKDELVHDSDVKRFVLRDNQWVVVN